MDDEFIRQFEVLLEINHQPESDQSAQFEFFERIIPHGIRAAEIIRKHEKLSKRFDIQAISEIFRGACRALGNLLIDFQWLQFSYQMAPESDPDTYTSLFDANLNVIVPTVDVIDTSFEILKATTFYSFMKHIQQEFEWEDFKRVQSMWDAWKTGKKTTQEMVEWSSTAFADYPYCVEASHMFLLEM